MRCDTENCDGIITDKAEAMGKVHCAKCRANIASWDSRPTSDVIDRRKDLQRFSDRMSNVRGVKNVQMFRRKKAARR